MEIKKNLKIIKNIIGKHYISVMIMLFTIVSLTQILYIRTQDVDISLFWIYTALMTVFVIFMYMYESKYAPIPDLGFRPTITVIIPAKNEEGAIQATINAVLDSDYPPEKLDVVAVDDGSTDGTADRMKAIKSDRVTVIKHEKNQGKRVAFASGFKVSKGEIIVAIDSDSYVDKNAVKLLVQPFVNDKIAAVAGHGMAYNKDKNILTLLQHYWYQEMFRLVKGMESRLGCVTCCSGVLAAYRKSSLTPIMDEWLGEKFLGRKVIIGDDRQLTNFVLRGSNEKGCLSTRDIQVTYQSNAIVHTVVPDNIKQFTKQQLRWKRSWLCETWLACKFMWKKPFPIPIYFYGYNFLTYVSPLIIIIWLVWRPLHSEWDGMLSFIIGTYYIGFLHALNVWKHDTSSSDSIIYRTLFVTLSIVMSIFIIPYALITVRKDGWITRGQ
jgi:hyaluronan synthase